MSATVVDGAAPPQPGGPWSGTDVGDARCASSPDPAADVGDA
ncbi:MAG: hypothetical protein V4755_03285 [Curtobacterium sp.]